jgi:hypothetical protein
MLRSPKAGSKLPLFRLRPGRRLVQQIGSALLDKVFQPDRPAAAEASSALQILGYSFQETFRRIEFARVGFYVFRDQDTSVMLRNLKFSARFRHGFRHERRASRQNHRDRR